MERHKDAARLLLSARRDPAQPLVAIPAVLAPKTIEQAVLIQREVMAELGAIGGWKSARRPPPARATAPLCRVRASRPATPS